MRGSARALSKIYLTGISSRIIITSKKQMKKIAVCGFRASVSKPVREKIADVSNGSGVEWGWCYALFDIYFKHNTFCMGAGDHV